MRQPKPDVSHSEATRLFRYDKETGVLTRRVTVHYKAKEGDVVGSPNDCGYLQVTIAQKKYKVHRLIWFMVTGSWPRDEIDHRDIDKTNHKWGNLREATGAQNMQNSRHARKTSLTGFLGVTWIKKNKRFASRIYHKRLIHLGCFGTAESAYAAYLSAKRELHEGNTL